MKALIIKAVILSISIMGSISAIAQTAELTIEVKGIKEAKGKILIALKDSKDPQKNIFEMVDIKNEGSVICNLKNVPVGKVDISIFQDVNENYKLEMDENNIPLELCYKNEKLKITEGENKLVAKLINVKEMMGSQTE